MREGVSRFDLRTNARWTAEKSSFERGRILVTIETSRCFRLDFFVTTPMIRVPVAQPDDQFLHTRFIALLTNETFDRLRSVFVRP